MSANKQAASVGELATKETRKQESWIVSNNGGKYVLKLTARKCGSEQQERKEVNSKKASR